MMNTQELDGLKRWGYSPSAVARHLPRPSPAPPVPPPRLDLNRQAETLARLHAQELRTALSLRLSRELIDQAEEVRRDRQIAARRRRGRRCGAIIVLSLASGAVAAASAAGSWVARMIVSQAPASGGIGALVAAEANAVRWGIVGLALGACIAIVVWARLNRVPE